MIELRNITLAPSLVNTGGKFTLSAEVIYTKRIYTWGDLAGMTWEELSLLTWGELYSYRNPDNRDRVRCSGTFYCGEDFGL